MNTHNDKVKSETVTHTPGPWHFTDQLESKGQSIYTVGYTDETGERTHDVRFIPPVSDWKTAHANARLIAAAPDLLQACKAILEEWKSRTALIETCDLTEEEDHAVELAENAISKAEGHL